MAVVAWPLRSEAEAITAAVLTEAFDALQALPDRADFPAFCLRLLARASVRAAADGSVSVDC